MNKMALCLTEEGLKYLDAMIRLEEMNETIEFPERELLSRIQEELFVLEDGSSIYKWIDVVVSDSEGCEVDTKVFINMLLSGYVSVTTENVEKLTEGYHGPYKLEK